jgi:hypothetical protein
MKTLIYKLTILMGLMVVFAACKKEVYPEELNFKVIDSFTRKPIPNATVQLVKIWRHPIKIGNNAKDGDWFPEYGRKHMQEIQIGLTDKNGKVSFNQDHKNYLYIIPGATADGYQGKSLDTLSKFDKKKADGVVYTLEMDAKVKTTFVFKSNMTGFNSDSVVFSSCDSVKVMRGAIINDKLVVYSSNYTEPYSKVWYTANIFRRGKKVTRCHYVISHPNVDNVIPISIDI